LRHWNLLRGLVALKSLQKIEMTAGDMLAHHLSVHRTKLLTDPSLKIPVQGRGFVPYYSHA
jgi:hypothetical protein